MHTSNMKALAAIALTGVGSALVINFQVPSPGATASMTTTVSGSTTAMATTASASTASATASSGSSTSAGSSAAPTATSTTASTNAYANGTWTGTGVSEPWGTFQVQAVVSGGKLTNVVVVSEPQDGHSTRINSQAVPLLTQSAVASQGASVDAVSGATWTSQSYTTSLQAALDQARAAAQNGG